MPKSMGCRAAHRWGSTDIGEHGSLGCSLGEGVRMSGEERRHRRARVAWLPAGGGARGWVSMGNQAAHRRRERGRQRRSAYAGEHGHRGWSSGEGARTSERMSTGGTVGRGAGLRHLKVGDKVATNPKLLGDPRDEASGRRSRLEMGRRRRVRDGPQTLAAGSEMGHKP